MNNSTDQPTPADPAAAASAPPATGTGPHLRQRAEAAFQAQAAQLPADRAPLSPEAIQRTLHELRVHQIELEMQNEELRHSQAELSAAKARYFDLYDLAPVGYLTVSEEGLIRESNLSAAKLLGKVQSALVKRPLSQFILKEDQEIYYRLRQQLLATDAPQACELRMVKPDGEWFWARLSATAEQDEGDVTTLRVVLTDITKRKQAETALNRSEQKFRALFDSTNDAVMLLDQKGFFDCNQATLQIMGCSSREEFCTKHPADLSPPQQPGGLDSLPLAAAWIAAAMAQGSQRFEWVHRRADTGASFPAEVLLNPFQLEGRTVVQAVVHDITERKQAEVALTASVSLLNATLESTADGILVVDLAGRIKRWNQKFAEMWRIPAVILASHDDQLVLDSVLGQLLHPEEFLAKVKALYQQPEATSRDQIDLADGRVFFRYSQPQRIGAAVVGRVWSFSDITESKQAADRLQQSEQKFRLLLQSTAQGIYGVDRQGNCTFANPACGRMLGYEQEEDLLGRHIHTLTHHTRPDGTPYPASDCRLHQALTDPAGTHVADECFWRRDGSSFPVEYWAHPILHDGQIVGVVAAFFDITERRQAEAKVRELLAQTQQDAHIKVELLKEVNHRVKNNLLAILGLALAEQRHAATEEKPVAQRITANLRRRIEGLLEVHQMLSASQWSPLPVSQLAETIIRAALAAAPANCLVTVAVSPSPVKVSPRQASNLALVFNELATNTVKYAIANRTAARVTLAATATASLIRLEYRDDGPGYPPAVLRQEHLSVGMTLVRDLTTQTLRGQLTLANDAGAVTVLEIKTEEFDRT